MARRIIVGAVAGIAGLITYSLGGPRWLPIAVGLAILALADRLGIMPGPFEPSVRDLLHEAPGPDEEHRSTGRPSFHSLARVETDEEVLALRGDTDGVLIRGLTDDRLALLARRLPGLRHLIADGNNRVTDAGLECLSGFSRLEDLDLEWSAITDAGLPAVAAVPSLRWVDVGLCRGVTAAGIADLRRRRPDLEISNTEASDPMVTCLGFVVLGMAVHYLSPGL